MEKYSKEVMMDKFAELEAMCKPLQSYLIENHDPHTEITVSFGGIIVKQDVMYTPFKCDQPED